MTQLADIHAGLFPERTDGPRAQRLQGRRLALAASLAVHGLLAMAMLLVNLRPPPMVPATLNIGLELLRVDAPGTQGGGAGLQEALGKAGNPTQRKAEASASRAVPRQSTLGQTAQRAGPQPGTTPTAESAAAVRSWSEETASSPIPADAEEPTTDSGSGALKQSGAAAVPAEGGGAGQGAGGTAAAGSSGGNRLVAFGADGGPRFLRYVRPVYPSQARRQGQGGRVVLRLRIDAQGRLLEAEVAESGGEALDAAALESVRASTYAPAMRDGVAVECLAALAIRFRLAD